MNDNYIREFRKKKKMTQKELAEAAEINIRMVQFLEAGDRLLWNTTVSVAMKIAAALGVELTELLKESENSAVKDISAVATKKEMQAIKEHCAIYSGIGLDLIEEYWRDQDGFLCVKYKENDWFHYNGENGTWW